jgi:hypothetical protein
MFEQVMLPGPRMLQKRNQGIPEMGCVAGQAAGLLIIAALAFQADPL